MITKRQRARAKRLNILFICLSLLVSGISIVLIIVLLNAINKPTIVNSPIAMSYVGLESVKDRYQSTLEKLLKENNINYSSILRFGDGSYEVKLFDSKVVIMSSQKDINLQLSSLQYILSRLTMEGKRFSRLDLRFDKPVIVLK